MIVTHPLGPLDNLELYRLLGGIFGREEEANQLETAFRAELQRLQAASRPRRDVLYLIWREPWMTVSPDTYISRTLALVNLRTVPMTTPSAIRSSILPPSPARSTASSSAASRSAFATSTSPRSRRSYQTPM